MAAAGAAAGFGEVTACGDAEGKDGPIGIALDGSRRLRPRPGVQTVTTDGPEPTLDVVDKFNGESFTDGVAPST